MGKEWGKSAACGLAVLGALQLLGPWLGFSIRLNVLSLGIDALLGIPGIIGLMLARVLLLCL